MKQILELILALPLSKFGRYLSIQKKLEPGSLLRSVLLYKAIQAGFSEEEVILFNDPLESALRKFNHELPTRWRLSLPTGAEKSKEMSEDDRIDFIVRLIKELDQTCSPNLMLLSQKIGTLIDLYSKTDNGYIAFTLTSLQASILYVKSQKSWRSFFSKNNLAPAELPPESLQILNVYASISESIDLKLINLLRKVDNECIDCQAKIMCDGKGLASEVYQSIADSLVLLRACIYDKGKDVAERLQLFKSVFAEERKKFNVVFCLPSGAAIKEFMQNVTLLIGAQDLSQNSLFVEQVNPAAEPVCQSTVAHPTVLDAS